MIFSYEHFSWPDCTCHCGNCCECKSGYEDYAATQANARIAILAEKLDALQEVEDWEHSSFHVEDKVHDVISAWKMLKA
jgi:hypothetical protein